MLAHVICEEHVDVLILLKVRQEAFLLLAHQVSASFNHRYLNILQIPCELAQSLLIEK